MNDIFLKSNDTCPKMDVVLTQAFSCLCPAKFRVVTLFIIGSVGILGHIIYLDGPLAFDGQRQLEHAVRVECDGDLGALGAHHG